MPPVDSPRAPRVSLGRELRLATVPHVIAQIDRILIATDGMPTPRIELDASGLRSMTEGARRMLLVATARLAERHVDLVVTGCEPFDQAA
jgi:hypothetical protein